MKALVAMRLGLFVGGCAHRHAAPPAEMSGFLDDYALLREGGPNDSALVYRAPDANWSAYDKVLLEPVTLWRSGRKSLEPVPQEDLLRLVTDFQSAVRQGLGERFRVVDQAGTGVTRPRSRPGRRSIARSRSGRSERVHGSRRAPARADGARVVTSSVSTRGVRSPRSKHLGVHEGRVRRGHVRGPGASPSVMSGWKDPAGAASSSAQSTSSSSR